ncbi:MAG: iron ABC transporter permease [Betaproteobacteria bacterium]
MQRRLTLLSAVAVVIIAGLLPLAAMMIGTVTVDGTLTLSVYRKLFGDPARYLNSVSHTLVLAGLTAVIALGLGVALGLLLGKTDVPLRRTFAVLFAVPLFMPPYILAVSWSDLFARNGPVFGLLPESVSTAFSRWLYGLPGCVWVLVSALMPIVMILTIMSLRTLNPRLEEAARVSANWSRTLRHVTLPIVQPAIIFAGLIVFLLAVGEVAVPMLLRYPVYPVETLVQFAAFYDFAAAAATAVPLLLLAALLVGLERRYLRDRAYRVLAATPGKAPLQVPLREWRIPAALTVGAIAGCFVLLPMGALVHASLSPLGYVDAWRQTADSLMRTVLYAVIGATLLTAVGFLCGYLIERRAARWWRAVDTLTLLLFTVPGTVIGVGLIALWNHPGTGWLYASSAMIILAYLAQYSALTTRISLATLASLPASLEDAAKLSGAPWFARLGRVLVPAALPGVIAAWIVAFIFCLRDVGASMLVYPAGADPLPVRIFTLMANGSPSLIAAACVTLVAVNLAMLAVLAALLRMLAGHR